MDFDFETTVDRSHQGSLNESLRDSRVRERGLVAFTAAEMDFPTAPCILEAYHDRVANGLFGYTLCDEPYRAAVQHWMETMRSFRINAAWIVPTYGTIFSLSTAIRTFTVEGDGVIVQKPVYMRYEQAIARNNRRTVNNPLRCENGAYTMDFDDLDRRMAEERTRLMVLCNPHNPVGRVWSEDELKTVAELASRHGVVVFSDEIFAEITFGGRRTVPYSEVPEAAGHALVATSLGKVFNFTGVNHANIIVSDRVVREAFLRQRDTDHFGSIDPFAYTATLTAYRKGGDWVRAAIAHIGKNIRLLSETLSTHLPQTIISEVQGTFVMWIDWRALGLSEKELTAFLVEEAHLQLEPGSSYGEEGRGFTRMSVATSRANICRALDLLIEASKRRGYAV